MTNKDYKKLEQELLSRKHTEIIYYKEIEHLAPDYYRIFETNNPENIFSSIKFQTRPTLEAETNGIFIEDLMAICIDRLEYFQKSEFSCRENAMAITKLEEAMLWLRKRTLNRKKRGVLGKSVK